MMHRFFRFLATSLVLFAFSAFAQDGAVVVPDAPPTFLGTLYSALAGLAFLAVSAGVAALAAFLVSKAKNTIAEGLVAKLADAMKAAVAHAEVELRPQIQSALADGTLTAEEAQVLKAKTLEVFKSIAGDLLKKVPSILGFAADGIPAFLSGLLERTLLQQKAIAAASTPAPATTPVAKVAPVP